MTEITITLNEKEIMTLRNALEYHQSTAVDCKLPWGHIAKIRKRIETEFYLTKDME